MTPPPYPPYPPYPPSQPPKPTGLVVGMAAVGALTYPPICFVALIAALVSGSEPVFFGTIFGLSLFGLVGGAGLVATRRPWAKGLGIGLMIGWALAALTFGSCVALLSGALG